MQEGLFYGVISLVLLLRLEFRVWGKKCCRDFRLSRQQR